MPLDERGVWIDQIRDCDCGLNAEQPTGPTLPEAPTGERIAAPKGLQPAPPPVK